MQSQVLGLARVMSRQGHDVVLLAPGEVRFDESDPVRFEPPDESFEIVSCGPATPVEANGSIAPIAIGLISCRTTITLLLEREFDILHLHEPLVPGPCMTSLLIAKVPIIGTFHLSGVSASYRYLRPIVTRMARRLTKRCAVSPLASQTAAEWLGGEYEVLFNGIDLNLYGFGEEPIDDSTVKILFVGRHEERKGLHDLLRAFVQASDQSERTLHLDVIGTGPETEYLKAKFQKESNIDWLGEVDDGQVRNSMGECDILCAPSRSGESFGIVLVEAMASRTAIIASQIDGYVYVADGVARFFPPGDIGELSRILLEVANNFKLCESMVRAGSERATHFELEVLAEEYLRIYQSSLGL